MIKIHILINNKNNKKKKLFNFILINFKVIKNIFFYLLKMSLGLNRGYFEYF